MPEPSPAFATENESAGTPQKRPTSGVTYHPLPKRPRFRPPAFDGSKHALHSRPAFDLGAQKLTENGLQHLNFTGEIDKGNTDEAVGLQDFVAGGQNSSSPNSVGPQAITISRASRFNPGAPRSPVADELLGSETPVLDSMALSAAAFRESPAQPADVIANSTRLDDHVAPSSLDTESDNANSSGPTRATCSVITSTEVSDQPSEVVVPSDGNADTKTAATERAALLGSDVHMDDFEQWVDSRQSVVNFLHKRCKVEAVSILDFLADNKLVDKKTIGCQLKQTLSLYVLVLRDASVGSPCAMSSSRQKLSTLDISGEEFLTRVWQVLKPRPATTLLNAELHSGPWYDLIPIVGRDWVMFLLLHCYIFKPLFQHPGYWTQLTGSFFAGVQMQRFNLRSPMPDSRNQYITKADVMYQKRQPWRKVSFERCIESAIDSPHLRELVQISERRLAKYRGEPQGRRLHHGRRGWAPHSAVVAFLNRALHTLLPLSLLGSQRNRKSFEKSLALFIGAPGYKKIPLRTFLKGIRLREVPWLIDETKARLSPGEGEAAFLQCMAWVLNTVVKSVLVHHFYMTEMSGMPGSIYYYEQRYWNKVMETPIRGELMAEARALPNSAHAPAAPANEGDHPSANWRVVPKPDGSARPIVNLKAYNKGLHAAHLVLQEAANESSTRISSWHSWVTRLYEFKANFAEQVHIVTADISGCYENANLEKVKRLVLDILDGGETLYRVQPVKWLRLHDAKVKSQRHMVSSLPSERSPWQSSFDARKQTCVVSERPGANLVTGKDVFRDVEELLDNLQVKVKRDMAIPFHRGIPQGSACSLDLCNILLDDLVETKLKGLATSRGCLLLRYVDDFLFVSVDAEAARLFEQVMLRGFEDEYGLKCKPAKIFSSVSQNGKSSSQEFRYLGQRIAKETLDIRPVPVSMHFRVRSRDVQSVRRALARDMERMLAPLRAFKRERVAPPDRLMRETLQIFGRALVDRLAVLGAEYGRGSGVEVYSWAVKKYILPLVPGDRQGDACWIVREGFKRQVAYEKRGLRRQQRRN